MFICILKVLANLMNHRGHASFVDYDGQVFIPILNITFPFWSAFYCTIAQITYLQDQAQKHNTVWQREKMILGLLFLSVNAIWKWLYDVDWGRMSTKSFICRGFKATLFVTWCRLVMNTLQMVINTCSPVQFLSARSAYEVSSSGSSLNSWLTLGKFINLREDLRR